MYICSDSVIHAYTCMYSNKIQTKLQLVVLHFPPLPSFLVHLIKSMELSNLSVVSKQLKIDTASNYMIVVSKPSLHLATTARLSSGLNLN